MDGKNCIAMDIKAYADFCQSSTRGPSIALQQRFLRSLCWVDPADVRTWLHVPKVSNNKLVAAQHGRAQPQEHPKERSNANLNQERSRCP